jgi:hypothetical protein
MEDRLPVLDGRHAPRGERPPVTDAVHLVDDRRGGVAGAEEVRVQRVGAASLDRPAGGDERLARDLAAEDALAALVGAPAAEQVHLELLEVEDVDELLERA